MENQIILDKKSFRITGCICAECNMFDQHNESCILWKTAKRSYNDVPKKCKRLQLEIGRDGKKYVAESVYNSRTGCKEVKVKEI